MTVHQRQADVRQHPCANNSCEHVEPILDADMPEQVIRSAQADCGGLAWTRAFSRSAELRYSSEVQQPWRIQVDAGGRTGTSDLLKQLVTLLLPVATDQKVVGVTRRDSSPPLPTSYDDARQAIGLQ
jgi:hypothetical protein